MFAKRFFRFTGVMLCFTFASAGAVRAEVALGASFGYTHVSYTSPDFRNIKSDVFGVPGAGDGFQPGIRVAYVAPSRR